MNLAHRPVDIFQVFGETPQVLAEVLQDGVNLAVWRRRFAGTTGGLCRTGDQPWPALG